MVEALDFVIVNEQLQDDFDSFKKTEVRPRFSYVPAIELVSLFCKCADIMVPCVIRYESDYYELDESQFDELVVWSSQIEICIMDVQIRYKMCNIIFCFL